MKFSLPKVGIQLAIFLVGVLLLSSHVKSGTPVELPQTQNIEHDEANLTCILGVLREFDERRSESPLAEIKTLYNHIQPGVDRNIDLNTLLLQYYNLKDIDDRDTGYKFQPRKMINECNLNLEPSISRCQYAYGGSLPCEQVEYGSDEYNKAPFAAPKCPFGYQRYGCCKCLRTCNYTESIEADGEAGEDPTNVSGWTKTNYCIKKEAIRSEVKRLSGRDRHEVGLTVNDWEILEETDGDFLYVKNCPVDFKRMGSSMCISICPLGWPDNGNTCYKQGELIFYPFVWQPGDQKVVPKN